VTKYSKIIWAQWLLLAYLYSVAKSIYSNIIHKIFKLHLYVHFHQYWLEKKKRRKYASYESAESILGYPKHAGAWGKCELWEQRQALGPVIFGFEILW
jgi:hypothetical protein